MLEPESRQLIGAILVDRYRIQSKLGSGGMSTVYLAVDLTLDRPVAIKLLHREISDAHHQLERFEMEAKSAASLSDPHLVSVIDAGEQGGRPFIVFEYVEGRTLKELIASEGALPVDQAVAYAIEIGRGLSAAHENRLIHRDVKPQNVLIDSEGRARVTDFGIARSLEEDGVTDTGDVIGTTDYVSPEQASGEPADERSDVYSLGIVLFEMLTGRVPFEADSQVAVAMKHVSEPIPDVAAERPGVPTTVAAVVDKSTEKDPERRQQSMSALVDDLEISLDESTAREPLQRRSQEATAVLESVPRARRPLSSSRASRLGVAMGGLGLLLIAGALVWGGSQLSSSDEPALPLVRISDFDPEGDGTEHPSELGRIVDGNPSGSAWSSETYSSPTFGNKSGVGFYVQTDGQVDAGSLELRLSEPGAAAEVFTAPGELSPPPVLGGWKRVAGGSRLSRSVDLGLAEASEPSAFYLVWFRRLPPSDAGGGYRVEVSDLRLTGR